MKSYGFTKYRKFSLKFDVESCPMPQLGSIEDSNRFHWTLSSLFAGDIKMSIMMCSVVCFSQAMNQDKRVTTCVAYLSQVMA